MKHKLFTLFVLLVLMLAGIVSAATANSQANTVVVPVGYNFPIALNTGQDVIKGKPGIAFDGTNFLVPYAQGMDIYARRVTSQGAVLDTTPIVVSVGLNESAFPPSVIFDGTNYFLAWAAMRAGISELYGARVTPFGTVLDPGGVKITTGGDAKIRMPGLAFDGVNFLVVWRTNSDLIYAARVSTSIVNLDAPSGFPVATTGASWYPAAAFDGANYLVIWHDGRNYGTSGYDIYGARVSPQGSVLEPNGFVICDAPQNQDHSTVGFDGANFLVAWYDWRPNNDNIFGSLYGARVASNGTVLDTPSFQIADRARGQVAPSVVCGGDNCLVIWDTDYPNIGTKFRLTDVWGRRVSQDGTILDPQAIPVATAYGHQFGALAGYGGGRYLVVWSESTGREWVGAIYGQILEQQAGVSPQSVISSQQIPASNPDDENWTIEGAPITDHALAGIAFSPTNSWAFGGKDAFHYQNGVWQAEAVFPTEHIYGSWASSPSDLWITGWCGAFSYYNGQSWTDKGCTLGEGGHITTGLWGIEANNLWASKNNGKLLHYNGSIHDGWLVDTGLPLDFSDIWGTANNNIYAVGERGLVFRYNDSIWSRQTGIPSIQRLNAIWGSGPNDIFAVGDWGTILHFDGTAWSAMTGNTLQHLYDVWGWSGTDVYAVGFGGTILHYNGTAWASENGGTTMDLLSVWGAPGKNTITVWASGSGQQILKKVKPALTIASAGAYDGWILESTETSNKGGTLDKTATTFNLGDGVLDRQYRAILSFNTGGLPDTAVITKVTLKIKKQGLVGTNPFTILGGLKVDMRKPFFGTTVGLVIGDFQAAAGKSNVATFGATPVSNWYSAVLNATGRAYVNKTGTTQFRLRFVTGDNDDNAADYMKFFSGDYATVSARPTLIIEYHLPIP